MSEPASSLPAIGVAWTGASGLVYGVRLVDVLLNSGRDVNLVVSSAVMQTAPVELGHDVAGLIERLDSMGPGRLRVWDRTDFGAPLASGSAQGGPLVIVPPPQPFDPAHPTSGVLRPLRPPSRAQSVRGDVQRSIRVP